MVYKDEMGFVRLNTRCEEMRHLVYASNNGKGAQGKRKIERGQSIYRYKNILSVWPSCTEVEKERDPGCVLSIDLALSLMCHGHGLVDRVGKKMKHSTGASLSADYKSTNKTRRGLYEEESKQ